jgi:hypothetical protein
MSPAYWSNLFNGTCLRSLDVFMGDARTMKSFVRVLPVFSATLESISLGSTNYMESDFFPDLLEDGLSEEFPGLGTGTVATALPRVNQLALHGFDLATLTTVFPTFVPIATLRRICFLVCHGLQSFLASYRK